MGVRSKVPLSLRDASSMNQPTHPSTSSQLFRETSSFDVKASSDREPTIPQGELQFWLITVRRQDRLVCLARVCQVLAFTDWLLLDVISARLKELLKDVYISSCQLCKPLQGSDS